MTTALEQLVDAIKAVLSRSITSAQRNPSCLNRIFDL